MYNARGTAAYTVPHIPPHSSKSTRAPNVRYMYVRVRCMVKRKWATKGWSRAWGWLEGALDGRLSFDFLIISVQDEITGGTRSSKFESGLKVKLYIAYEAMVQFACIKGIGKWNVG